MSDRLRAAPGAAAPARGAADSAAREAPIAMVRGLRCIHRDGTMALDGVDFAVFPGEVVAIMGATGAGKSTLLKCLGGVIPRLEAARVEGERMLFGRPTAQIDPTELAGRIGIVFEDFEAQIFSTNVALEVGFGLDQLGRPAAEIRERSRIALERVGLAGFDRRDPATLSGGEKQRLAMAAIWALRPELVLLDEPTTDIDPVGKQAIFDLLSAFRDDGSAVVVVEHEPGAAAIADRLVILDAGRVRASGPSRELTLDVDLLSGCGVRPRDLDVVGARLSMGGRLDCPDDAARRIAGAGWRAQSRLSAVSAIATRVANRAVAGAAPLLEAREVRHVYPTGKQALDGVSLSIGPGEFIALVGRNGSGKTTLAKHLNGLLSPTSGQILLSGEDTAGQGIGRIARTVGFVFQDPDHQLFCDSVFEEVAFGPRHLGLDAAAVEKRVGSTLDTCGLGDRRDADPFLLSKGERQRLAVAAILALEPRILVLDEPMTGLDYREQRTLVTLLENLHRAGTTILVISHAPWFVVGHAERAIMMSGGRAVFDGPIEDLLARGELLREACFALPEATELGLRLAVAARSPEDLVERLEQGPPREAPR